MNHWSPLAGEELLQGVQCYKAKGLYLLSWFKESIWNALSLLFSSKYVCNCKELRAAQELRALCLRGNCYFKSGLKRLLKLKNVPLTTALEVCGHGESTGLVYFTLYWVLRWDIWKEMTRHLNILERLWYRADDAQLSFSQWVYSLRFCLQQEYASCSCIQQVVQNECD